MTSKTNANARTDRAAAPQPKARRATAGQAAAATKARTGKGAAAAAGPSKPTWWTEAIQAAWNSDKAAANARFDRIVLASKRPEIAASRPAIAFGYGARLAYRRVWGAKLEARLQADWRAFGLDALSTWSSARAIVRYGWNRASIED